MPEQENPMKKVLDGDTALLVDRAQDLGRQLARGLKTSQLRNVYGAIRQTHLRLESDPPRAYADLLLLQPKMAYLTQRTRDLQPLKDAIDQAILVFRADKGPNRAHFQNFIDFCEAVVAYHRFYRPDRD